MMHAMSSKGFIPKQTKEETKTIVGCEICYASKMAQSPHEANGDDSHNLKKMDRIQLDLVGPMGVQSKHGGYTYFQTNMDVC